MRSARRDRRHAVGIDLGDAYAEAFANTYIELARENGAALIPFLLDGVASTAELNQPDGIHSTPEVHRRIADTVWRMLEPVLREDAASRAGLH